MTELFIEVTSNENDVVTGYYKYDDYNIHYEKVGHGKMVICMFPGACGNTRDDLGTLIDAFDKNIFTVVGIDAAGFGLSRPPERDYKRHTGEKNFYQYDAEIAVSLMESLGYNRFSALGWSDGGRTALLVAILFPSKVDKLVVWSTSSHIPDNIKPELRKLCVLQTFNREDLNKLLKRYGSMAKLRKIKYEHLDHFLEITNVCRDSIKDIVCPTLVLYGLKDPMITRELFEYLVKSIPKAQAYTFSDAGHNPHYTHVDEFNRIVLQFLGG